MIAITWPQQQRHYFAQIQYGWMTETGYICKSESIKSVILTLSQITTPSSSQSNNKFILSNYRFFLRKDLAFQDHLTGQYLTFSSNLYVLYGCHHTHQSFKLLIELSMVCCFSKMIIILIGFDKKNARNFNLQGSVSKYKTLN